MATKKAAGRSNKEIVFQGEVVPNQREAPPERRIQGADIILPVMSSRQMASILAKTPDYAVKKRQGRAGQMYKYVPHGYVTDQLNKVFGFDWDIIIDPMSNDGKMFALEYEINRDAKGNDLPPVRHIAVCGRLIVRVHKGEKVISTITKSGFGSQLWLPTMELGDALKGARSDLIKTCAYQFGIALDLYWNDQAELDSFVERQQKKEAEAKAAEQFQKMMSGNPDNPIALLSRAASEYGINMETLLGFAAVKDEDAFMNMDEAKVHNVWENLKQMQKNAGK